MSTTTASRRLHGLVRERRSRPQPTLRLTKHDRYLRKTVDADKIAQARAGAGGQNCRCDLRPGMTVGDLIAMDAGCTAGRDGYGGYVCPVLDRLRRKMED